MRLNSSAARSTRSMFAITAQRIVSPRRSDRRTLLSSVQRIPRRKSEHNDLDVLIDSLDPVTARMSFELDAHRDDVWRRVATSTTTPLNVVDIREWSLRVLS